MNSFLSLLAYIDPGSGSAIISALIGFCVAVGLAIKTYWYKIKNFFCGKKSAEEKDASVANAEDS